MGEKICIDTNGLNAIIIDEDGCTNAKFAGNLFKKKSIRSGGRMMDKETIILAIVQLKEHSKYFRGGSGFDKRYTNVTVKALNKQIPQKVLFEDVGYSIRGANLYSCICPSCGLHIIDFSDDEINDECTSDDPEEMFHSSMVYHAYNGRNNYCNRCGQKLSWE